MNSSSCVGLRAQYRRELCNLLSSSFQQQDPIAKEMEVGLGKRAILHDRIANWKNPVVEKANGSSSLDMRVPTSLIHCDGCGCWMQGCSRIRIKAIKRGKTRRRRASRRKAALERSKSRTGKSYNQSNITRNGDLLTIDLEEIKPLFQVSDGTCKNIVVQTCYHCGFQHKTKGTLASIKKPQKPKIAPVESAKDSIFGADFISMNNNRKKTGADFISMNNNRKKTRKTSSYQSPLLISDSKKKKRKKGDKTDLMKFLSSLN